MQKSHRSTGVLAGEQDLIYSYSIDYLCGCVRPRPYEKITFDTVSMDCLSRKEGIKKSTAIAGAIAVDYVRYKEGLFYGEFGGLVAGFY